MAKYNWKKRKKNYTWREFGKLAPEAMRIFVDGVEVHEVRNYILDDDATYLSETPAFGECVETTFVGTGLDVTSPLTGDSSLNIVRDLSHGTHTVRVQNG